MNYEEVALDNGAKADIIDGVSTADLDIGTIVAFDSDGKILKVDSFRTKYRPFMVITKVPRGSAEGSGYQIGAIDDAIIVNNTDANFTIGAAYYSDGEGGLTTTAVTTGWVVGTAIEQKVLRVKVEGIGNPHRYG